MGLCESNKKKYKCHQKNNKGKQRFCAPIQENLYNDNTNNFGSTINTISQIDLMSYNSFQRKKPSTLYKYNGTYYKKGEQFSLMTFSLHDIQGNSLLNSKEKNSQIYNSKINNNSIYTPRIEENENESTSNEILEIIYDGKMDEKMVEKSTDETTIDNYNEFIGINKKLPKKNIIDIYNKKNNPKKDDNGGSKKIESKKDSDGNLSK